MHSTQAHKSGSSCDRMKVRRQRLMEGAPDGSHGQIAMYMHNEKKGTKHKKQAKKRKTLTPSRILHVPACSTAPDKSAGKECSAILHSHATSGANGRAAPGCHLCPGPSLAGLHTIVSRSCGCKRSWCGTVRRGRGFGLSGGASSHLWGRPTARAAGRPETRATLSPMELQQGCLQVLPCRRPPQVRQSCALRLARRRRRGRHQGYRLGHAEQGLAKGSGPHHSAST